MTEEHGEHHHQAVMNLKGVQPIRESRNTIFKSRAEIARYVEGPLRSACEKLYDKNIQTLESSANFQDIEYGGEARIVINFDTLSDENKEIAQEVGELRDGWDGMNVVVVKIPITENSRVEEIETAAEGIANQFKEQPFGWVRRYTLKELRKFYGIDENDETYGAESFADQFYYDEDSKTFFLSKEHAEKFKSSQEK